MGSNDENDFVREIVLRRQIAMLSSEEFFSTSFGNLSASLQPRIIWNNHRLQPVQPPPPGIPINQRPPENIFRGAIRSHRMPLRSNRPLNCPFSDRRRHGRKLSQPTTRPQLRFWMRQPILPHLRHRLPRPPSTTLPRSDYGRNSTSANHPPDGRLQLYSMSPNLMLMIDNTPRRRRRRPRRRMNRAHLKVAFNNNQQVLEEQEDDEEEIHSVCEAYKDLHYYSNDNDTSDDDNNDGYINNNSNALSNTGTISF